MLQKAQLLSLRGKISFVRHRQHFIPVFVAGSRVTREQARVVIVDVVGSENISNQIEYGKSANL